MKKKNETKMRRKKQQSPTPEPKWIVLIVVGLIAFVAITSFALYRYYNEPVVARINGVNIRAHQVVNELWQAENALIEELLGAHPDIMAMDYDFYDLPFRGQRFGRVVREQAVRNLAADIILREHAERLERLGLMEGAPPVHEMSEQEVMAWVVWTIANNDNEFAAFESFLPDEELVNARELAESLLERLLAGEDFDTLMAEYGEDPGMRANPDGYTFTSGMMVQEFEEGTLALEIGEISDVIETVHGYHIILRIEPDPYDDLFGPFHEDEYLLGAKHILIRHSPSLLDLRQQAVFDGIQAQALNMPISNETPTPTPAETPTPTPTPTPAETPTPTPTHMVEANHERETIILGMASTFIPFNFIRHINEGEGAIGRYSGVSVALVAAIAEELNTTANIENMLY